MNSDPNLFDAQTEKGNLNNFEANNKSRVRGQYTPLNTNLNERSPLAKISDDCHPQLCQLINIAPCRGIQDSIGFWIPRRGFRIPGARFQILCPWNLVSGFLELYSRFTATASVMAYPPLPHEQEKLQRLQIASARPYCYRKKSRLTSLQFERVYSGSQRKKELIFKFSWSRAFSPFLKIFELILISHG